MLSHRFVRTHPRSANLALVLSSLVVGISCEPTTLSVTTTRDGGEGSLRAAIARANSLDGDLVRIELSPGVYELTRCGGDDDTNAEGDLDIINDNYVVIQGTGPGVVIRQTCAGERVLDARAIGRVTFTNLTLTGGSVMGTPLQPSAVGGAIRSQGEIVLDSVTVTGNSATAINGAGAAGGGVWVMYSLSVQNSTFTANSVRGGDGLPGREGGHATGGAAVVSGHLTVTSSQANGNHARGGNGGPGENCQFGGPGGEALGGAFAQTSGGWELQMSNLQLRANTARGGDAGGFPTSGPCSALPTADPEPAGDAQGGAIAVLGSLTAKQITAEANLAAAGDATSLIRGGSAYGGALSGNSVSVQDSSFTGNEAKSGLDGAVPCLPGAPCNPVLPVANGGAVATQSNLVLDGVRFLGNAAVFKNHGLARGGAASSEAAINAKSSRFERNNSMGSGGALESPRLELTYDTLLSNTAGTRGGALAGTSVTLTRSTLKTNQAGREGGAVAAETLVVYGVLAEENRAGSFGGAFSASGNARIEVASIARNRVVLPARQAPLGPPPVGAGAGVYVGGLLQITRTDVLANDTGGALDQAVQGGGIFAGTVRAQQITVASNVVSGYTTTSAISVYPPHLTGGAGIASTGSIALVNSTISDNRVVSLVDPAGVFEAGRGAALLGRSLELEHTTVADNSGAASLEASEVSAARSAVSSPSNTAVCGAGTVSEGSLYNWFTDASCGLPSDTNQQVHTDFFLASLANNGGQVFTRLPAQGSVLVDAVPANACTVTLDARSASRPVGAGCDIGAVERLPQEPALGLPTEPEGDLGTGPVEPPPLPQCPTPIGEAMSSAIAADPNQPVYFNGGSSLPAGTYQLSYVDGCMKYSGNYAWTIHTGSALSPLPAKWWLVRESPTERVLVPPGTVGYLPSNGAFADFAACVAANQEQPPIRFQHPGGRLAIWLSDDNYPDNVGGLDGRNPKWRLERLTTCE
ncbi:MAG TPA: choice-of-anchor Q domain-containing protein [Polyangiaceae bacterium]|nr:choice-of-anchor Q domain-containing protein [Polyangiaceae bacterium]